MNLPTALPSPAASTPLAARPTNHVLPVLITAAGEHATIRFVEFFASTIRNPHTRRAYARAVADFLAWCADAQRRQHHGGAAAARRGLDREANAKRTRPRP